MPVIRARGMSGRYAGRLSTKALDRAAQALLETHTRLERDQLARTTYIQEPLGLAIGLRRIPDRLALISDEPRDHLGEVTDPGLLTSADIHRLGRLESLSGEE